MDNTGQLYRRNQRREGKRKHKKKKKKSKAKTKSKETISSDQQHQLKCEDEHSQHTEESQEEEREEEEREEGELIESNNKAETITVSSDHYT